MQISVDQSEGRHTHEKFEVSRTEKILYAKIFMAFKK
jgi:hypothetical protein